jgi:hypothetical protein
MTIACWPVSVVRRSLTAVESTIRDDSVSICFELPPSAPSLRLRFGLKFRHRFGHGRLV